MNLKAFNTENVKDHKPRGKAFISFHKNGMCRLSDEAAAIMQVQPGSQLQFNQDQDNPENWFMEVVKKDGFTVREASSSSSGLLFNAASIKRMIFESLNYQGENARIYLGEEVQYQKRILYTLVTAKLKANTAI